ncbi:hypothetical protein CRUP_020851 [Coryphaenoides rupestris]|nr:hypothetical protein CRUP_020851 [Coryphaenoides rupestris]
MSYCREEGLILPNGDINWNCPCLGGMASGPCGSQFKEAFSCFHYSTEDMKGSNCIDKFRDMQECMQRYPDLYPQEEDGESKAPPEESGSAPTTDSDAPSSSSQAPPSADSTAPSEGQNAS